MFKFSPPSPASVPVHVTGMLVVPENVHTGDPPFLKCGLDAKAAVAMTATMSGTKGTISTRFICFLPFLPPPDRPPFGKASNDKPRRTTCFTPLEVARRVPNVTQISTLRIAGWLGLQRFSAVRRKRGGYR